MADGHLIKPRSLISDVLVWGLCSVVLGKPLSVFSGRCQHNPVHTPILSLYRKTINKKMKVYWHLLLISTVCVKLSQVCVHEMCVYNDTPPQSPSVLFTFNFTTTTTVDIAVEPCLVLSFLLIFSVLMKMFISHKSLLMEALSQFRMYKHWFGVQSPSPHVCICVSLCVVWVSVVNCAGFFFLTYCRWWGLMLLLEPNELRPLLPTTP